MHQKIAGSGPTFSQCDQLYHIGPCILRRGGGAELVPVTPRTNPGQDIAVMVLVFNIMTLVCLCLYDNT